MIVTRLKGGLGNQMFQFAYAFALSKKHNSSLILDRTFYNNYPITKEYTLREYELGIFPIEQTKTDLVIPCQIKVRNRYLHDLHAKLFRITKGLRYVKEDFTVDPRLYKATNDNSYLNGFWQNPSYFESIKSELIPLLQIKPALIDYKNRMVGEDFSRTNTVSIHIRGGDYYNKGNQRRFGGITSEYFRSAISLISKKVKDPQFKIFTNDKQKAIEIINHFGVNYEIMDINQGKQSYLDLYLMQKCRYNIIVNSSFSWWAAYLNDFKNKIVIAPSNWYGDQPSRSKQIICKDWQTI